MAGRKERSGSDMKPLVRKLKIAHVTGWIHVGGKENGIVNLVNRMAPDIFESHVYVFKAGGMLLQRIDRDKCRVVELGDQLGNDLSLYYKLFSLFRRHRIHLLHTRSWGTLLEGMIAAKMARVPLIVHGEHGLIKDDSLQHVLIQRGLWRLADRVVCVSEVLRDELIARIGFPRQNISVLTNGVAIENFDPAGRNDFRASLGLPDDVPLFGSIGRLVPVKNYPMLVRAAQLVIKELPQAHLVFIGDGPQRAQLEQLAQACGIAANVTILSWRKDVAKIYQALDVFVLSSVSEGMSNSILEAMASRTAVVATRVGGNSELVVHNETGFLVPSQDHAAMANVLLALLQNPRRCRQLGEAGRQRAEEYFSLEVMVRNYERMYLEVAARQLTFHPKLRERIDMHFGEEAGVNASALMR